MSAPAALTDEQKFQRAQERLQRSSRSAEVSRPAARSRGVHPADAVLLSQDSGVGKKAKAKSKFALLDDDAEDED